MFVMRFLASGVAQRGSAVAGTAARRALSLSPAPLSAHKPLASLRQPLDAGRGQAADASCWTTARTFSSSAAGHGGFGPSGQRFRTARSMMEEGASAVASDSSVDSPPDPAQGAASAATGASSGPASAGPQAQLWLVSGVADIPHPDKVDKGGEDAYFVSDCQRAVGVADGVGGWAEVGIDPGLYSKMLMARAAEAAAAQAATGAPLDPQAVLLDAYSKTDVPGSTTACVVVVNGSTLRAANLGDSGLVVVRDGKVAFKSEPQQHEFNFPFQMGSAASQSDPPSSADQVEYQLQAGDILVVGTDGLFDNVFYDEIAKVASHCQREGHPADVAAKVLGQYARMRAADRKYPSPFAYGAHAAGYQYLGGKMDDVTIVVSYVADSVAPSKL